MTADIAVAIQQGLADEEVVERVKAGEIALYEIIMRRYNQRLYRIAFAILRDGAEAEDVMQDAYVRAYRYLHQYAGDSAFSIWLTRIAVNEALRRLRLRKRSQQLEDFEQDEAYLMSPVESASNPEQRASLTEVRQLLEEAILGLPDKYRTVVMMRDIEQLSTTETAVALELTEENIKVRLHRGRAMMRSWLFARVGEHGTSAFPFMGSRCDHVVLSVFTKLNESKACFAV